MLLLLFGSSASGKTSALAVLRRRESDGLAIHDFDEIGIPPKPTTRFRHEANELWVRRALDYQSQGVDLLLAGQTPLGELLATPSANRLEDVSACLLDCDDDTRTARLSERRAEWWSRSSGQLVDYLNWAEWLRRHALDPQHEPHVVTELGSPDMCWERLKGLQRGDRRWRIRTIDSSNLSVERVGEELLAWVTEERAYSITLSRTECAGGASSASS